MSISEGPVYWDEEYDEYIARLEDEARFKFRDRIKVEGAELMVYLDIPFAVEALKRARGCLAKGWIQGEQAVDQQGDRIPPNDSRAVAWCSLGAIRSLHHYREHWEFTVCRHLTAFMGPRPINEYPKCYPVLIPVKDLTFWNDQEGMTQEEVLRVFDLAISAAEKGDWR